MSEHAHHGSHPDADLLGAFAEGALPEHERATCLEHLAGCSECREVVFLAQAAAGDEAPPEARPVTVPRRRRWFAPISVWAAAAVVVVLAASGVVFLRHRGSTPPPPQLIASTASPSAETPVPAPPPQEAPVPPSLPPLSAAKKALIEKPLAQPKASAPEAAAPPPSLETMQPVAPAPATPAATPPATAPLAFATPQSAPAAASASPQFGLIEGSGSASVTGTVTDPAGGAIARAQVSLANPAAGKIFAAATDSRGEYSLNGIPPGHYQLSFVSPGFKKASNTIDLQPQQIARADSALQLGSVAESISVTAESAGVTPSSGARGGGGGGGRGGRGGGGGGRGGRGGAALPDLPLAQRSSVLQVPLENATDSVSAEMAPILLPNKQPAVTTAINGKITLAADANGMLFLSSNSGKSWKAIKGKWKGKVVRLVTPPDATGAADAVYQLNTDSGAVWLSKDGSRWNPAPAAR